MTSSVTEAGTQAVLSTLPAAPAERRTASWVVLLSAVIFIAAVPFAKMPLAKVWAFIPIYESAVVFNDLITAMLLFAQFRIVRSRALLIMASGYLFTAAVAVVHALTFPGLFADSGLLGAGPQSTAWLYMFWHAGFPFAVIAYSLFKNHSREFVDREHREAAAKTSVLIVVGAVVGVALLATAGQEFLPAIMAGSHYTPAMIMVVGSVWFSSLFALIVLWRRRPHTVLDIWLMVVMCAWLFDVGLSAVFNAGRFDLGFYVGRIYGFVAASFVLIMLLFENATLYSKLAERTSALHEANRELESFSYSVSHDLRAPLRAVDGFTRSLEMSYADRLDNEGRQLLTRVRANTLRMGQLIEDLLEFSRLIRHSLKMQNVPLDDLVQEVFEELRAEQGERHIEFSVGVLGTVNADSALLRQALTNLLGNAIKFTGKTPGAVIEVGCREPESGGAKTFYVKDNGAGFDMQYADKLFHVFQRLHSKEEFDGTGIGLSLTQRIINRHGGRIWAESRPGHGAAFYFTLQPDSR